MTPKEFLGQYQEASDKIASQLQEITRLRAMAISTTQALSPDRVQTLPENRVEAIVAKIVDMERQVDESIGRLREVRTQVVTAIDTVRDPRHRKVLRLRYIDGKTLEEIAVEMSYNYRWVKRLHGRALQKLAPKGPLVGPPRSVV